MSTWNKDEIEELIRNIRDKALHDSEFRKLCLADVSAAVKEISGKELPEEVRLELIANTDDTITIIMPQMEVDELPEEAVDKVFGGGPIGGGTNNFVSVCGACGV